jgi:hypothetical protein
LFVVAASLTLGNIEKDEVKLAMELRHILMDLGPTFVKLGQLISSRADLLSPGFAAEMSKLQSDVTPYSSLGAYQVTAPLIIIIINMLMPAPMIVKHILESYWYSKYRGIGPNLASVADGQSCPSLG